MKPFITMDLHIFLLLSVMPSVKIVSVLSNLTDFSTLESVSGCYGEVLNASCIYGEVLVVNEIKIGVKPKTSECFFFSNTSFDVSTCCTYNETDCTIPLEAKWKYANQCNGKTSCTIEVEETLDIESCTKPGQIAGSIDNETDGRAQYSYIHMEYYCIEEARKIDICNYSTILSAHNISSNVLAFESSDTPEKVNETSCACSVEIDNCSSDIHVNSINIKTTSQCNQTLTVFDGAGTIILNRSCQEDTDSWQIHTINDSYIQFKMSTQGNYSAFWLAFRAAEETNVTIQCPPSTQLFCTGKKSNSETSKLDDGVYILAGFFIGMALCLITALVLVIKKRYMSKKDPAVQFPNLEQRNLQECNRRENTYVKFGRHSLNVEGTALETIREEKMNGANAASPNMNFLETTNEEIHLKKGVTEQSQTLPVETHHGFSKRTPIEPVSTISPMNNGLILDEAEDNWMEHKRRRTICKESSNVIVIEPRVQIVRPLNTLTDKTSENLTKKDELKQEVEAQNVPLDWNKIFRHLAKVLPTQNWKIFFNCLYGYGETLDVFQNGMSIDRKICEIETRFDIKQSGVETLFFELFKDWRELFGEHTDAHYIEDALKEQGYNCVLNEFRNLMRDPPKLNRRLCLAIEKTGSTEGFSQVQSNTTVYALYNQEQSQQAIRSSQNHFEMYQGQSNEYTLEMRRATRSQRTNMIKQSPLEHCAMTPNIERKRPFTSTDSDSDDYTCHKHRKYEKQVLPKKTSSCRKTHRCSKYSKQSRKLVSCIEVNEIIDLIKRYLPFEEQVLNEKEYHLFLDHTISIIMKKTRKSERDVLSISSSDYNETQEYKSKRFGHVHYAIETESTCLTLEQEEWTCLKLYADHARRKVIERCKKTDSFDESKYMFIRYDGTPLLQQIEDSAAIEETTQEKSCQASPSSSAAGILSTTVESKSCLDVRTIEQDDDLSKTERTVYRNIKVPEEKKQNKTSLPKRRNSI